jgi:cytochrome c-type biogenesis protein CcmE
VTSTVAPPSAPPPAPTPRPHRTRYIVAASVCGLAVVAVIALTVVLSDNVVYFRTVTEAVKLRSDGDTGRFRLAGAVVPGTIRETPVGVDFSLTDGKKTVNVVHRGDPPELFKPGAPVVAEGKWASVHAAAFSSDRIMIKHGSDYDAPKVDAKHAPKPDLGPVQG